jgi:hypothetical protein
MNFRGYPLTRERPMVSLGTRAGRTLSGRMATIAHTLARPPRSRPAGSLPRLA